MTTRARHLLARLKGCRRGATAVEYGLICALIVIAAFGAFQMLGTGVNGAWGNMSNSAQNAMS